MLRLSALFNSVNSPVSKSGSYLTILFKKNLGGESWDLSSNQQMGLEVRKNLGLLMLGEFKGGS